jgi:hypothetical protein
VELVLVQVVAAGRLKRTAQSCEIENNSLKGELPFRQAPKGQLTGSI